MKQSGLFITAGIIVMGLVIGMMYFTITNTEIKMRETTIAQQEVGKANFDKMFKVISQTAQVPQKFMKDANINSSKIPFRIPSGLSFVKIDQNTGLMTKDSDGILEPFIVGTEPYINNIIKLDSLSSINNNSISGTGSLLIQ